MALFGAAVPQQTGLRALDGVLFATWRELAAVVGFDAQTFDGWHGYDTDFTLRSISPGIVSRSRST